MIGRGAFQETDFFGMTLPIVKHSYLITDVNDIPRIVKEAFYIAQTGRPGPVVIDFPKNIQQQKTQPVWPTLDEIKKGLRGYTQPDLKADDLALNEIIGLIEKAERPVLYCGGGIITERRGGGIDEICRGHEHSGDDHDHGHRRFSGNASAFAALAGHARRGLRELGGERRISNTAKASNDPMVKFKDGADLLLAFGVRFDDRVTGKFEEFCKNGTIVHIDIDASELNKNRKANLPVVGDIKYALTRLNELIAKRPIAQKAHARGSRRSTNGRRKRRSPTASRRKSPTAIT